MDTPGVAREEMFQPEVSARTRVIEYDSCEAIPFAIRHAVGLLVAGQSRAVTLVPNPVSDLR